MALAREQCPEHPWLPESLMLCTSVRQTSRAYWHFADPDAEPWRFDQSIQLRDKQEGELVLDILESQRVGGVEFLKRL